MVVAWPQMHRLRIYESKICSQEGSRKLKNAPNESINGWNFWIHLYLSWRNRSPFYMQSHCELDRKSFPFFFISFMWMKMRAVHDFRQLSSECNCFFCALRLTAFASIHFENTFLFKLSSRNPFLVIFGPSKNNVEKNKRKLKESRQETSFKNAKCKKIKVKKIRFPSVGKKKRKDKCLSWCFGVCTTNDNVWKIPQFLFSSKTSYFYVCSPFHRLCFPAHFPSSYLQHWHQSLSH